MGGSHRPGGRSWRRRCLSAALVVVLAGCTGGPPPLPGTATTSAAATTPNSPTGAAAGPPTTAPAPTPIATTGATTAGEAPEVRVLRTEPDAPATRTDEILAALAERGPTVQLAIDAFDVTVADLPGASPSSLPDGDGLPLGRVMELVRQARGSLTTEQVAVIDAATAGEQIAVLDVPTAGGLRGPGSWLAAPADTARLTRLLQRTIADWSAYRPSVLSSYRQVVVNQLARQPKTGKLRTALMYVDPASTAAHPDQCQISITPLLRSRPRSDFYLQVVFAHELFHCYQLRISLAAPDWVVEGSADFAAYDLYRARSPAERQYELFDDWWTKIKTPLAESTYGAWPLYDIYRERTGGDAYAAIDAMLRSGRVATGASLAAGGMDGRIYALMVQTTSSRSTAAPDALWRYTWPGRSTDYGPRDNTLRYPTQGTGLLQVESLPHFSHAASRVPFSSAVVMVELSPSHGDLLTIAQRGTVSVGEGERAWFCLQPGVCRCPAGTSPKFDWTAAPPTLMLATPFQDEAAMVDVDARRWDPDSFCEKDPERPARSGHSLGDPHLRTFDGLSYDALQLGEFVTTRDPAGGFTVQERHEAATSGTAVTALALSDGTHRVTLTLPALEAEAVLRADGAVQSGTTAAAGGITATNTPVDGPGEDWRFVWPDGSEVIAHVELGINVTVRPAAARLPRLEGLLGSANGSFLDDLTSSRGGLDDLEAFQDRWVVTDATTAFDYEPGQGPGTFRSAPRPRPVPVDPAAVDACTASLGGAATSVEIRSCAFDVSATGVDGYTGLYQQVVRDREQEEARQDPDAPLPEPSPTTPPPTGAPGKQGSAAATLTGVVDPPGSAGSDAVAGDVQVVAGTVVLLRASCPADPDLDLAADLQIGQTHSSLFLCGPNVDLQTYDQQGDDVVPPGEAYALMTETGTLAVSLSTASDQQVAASVQVFVDPQPREIRGPDVPTTGEQITLDGTADTVVVWLSTGAGESVDWTVSGAPESVCRKISYVGRDSPNPMLGSVCGQQASFGLTPETAELPFVFFQRGDGPATFTLTRVPG